MKIVLNGERYDHKGSGSVGSLLKDLEVDERRVVVILNEKVVERSRAKSARLKAGDRIDLVTFAGGG